VRDTLSKLIAHWGYEFYCDEINQPYDFGGWFIPKDKGMNVTLDYIDAGDSALTRKQFKAFKAVQERATKLHFKEADRKLKTEDFGHTFSRMFSLLAPELEGNPFFSLDHYSCDPDSIKRRIIQGLALSRRQTKYWDITRDLRHRKYKERIKNTTLLHLELTNQILEKYRGRMLRLPKWIFDSEVIDTKWYVQRKNWFPSNMRKANEDLDRLELSVGSQCRLQEDLFSTMRVQLNIDQLYYLDSLAEPFYFISFPGTIPYDERIAQEVLDWCPNIWLFINDYNRNEQEIRLCKIPTKVCDGIKLPSKPSIFFADEDEIPILRQRDRESQLFRLPSEVAVINEWKRVEKFLNDSWPFRTLDRLLLEEWLLKMMRVHNFPKDLRGLELVKTYIRLYRELKVREDEERARGNPDHIPRSVIDSTGIPDMSNIKESTYAVDMDSFLDSLDLKEEISYSDTIPQERVGDEPEKSESDDLLDDSNSDFEEAMLDAETGAVAFYDEESAALQQAEEVGDFPIPASAESDTVSEDASEDDSQQSWPDPT
jgi:hypothetical protein